MTSSVPNTGKRPRSILAGQYGHPVHPILVTIPIGAWVASLIFDIIAFASSEDEAVFAEGAYWLIGIGVIGGLLAAVFGLVDLLNVGRGTKAFRTGLIHAALNVTVVVLFVIDFIIRAAGDYEEATVPGLIITIIALLLLTASGYLGGMLAYSYGIRVVDEETQAEGFRSAS